MTSTYGKSGFAVAVHGTAVVVLLALAWATFGFSYSDEGLIFQSITRSVFYGVGITYGLATVLVKLLRFIRPDREHK